MTSRRSLCRPRRLCPLFRAARRFGRRPALIDGEGEVSFREWDAVVRSLGAVLPRDRTIGLIARPQRLTLFCLPVFWRRGQTVVLLSPRAPEARVRRLAGMTGCRTVVDPRTVLRGGRRRDVHALRRPAESDGGVFVDPRAVATVVFTSGSSGEPRPVAHRLESHLFSALGANAHIPFGPGDRWFLALPLEHVGGLSLIFRCLCGGGGLVLPDPAGGDLLVQVKRGAVTHLSLVPTQMVRLLARRTKAPERIEAVLLGGGPVSDRLIRMAREAGWPVHPTYGLTEAASQVATGGRGGRGPVRVLRHRRLRIAADGEILVAGRTLLAGYWPAGRLRPPSLRGGWFPTGDLGRLDGKKGLLVCGRKDRMFVSGGENIQPEEVEAALLDIPGVEEAAVLGRPDEEFGALPAAVLKGCKVPPAEEISRRLRRSLEGFKVPRFYYRWPEGASLEWKSSFRVLQARLESGSLAPLS